MVTPKLRNQLRIFFALFVVFIGIALWHVIADRVNPIWLLPGLALGAGLGWLVSGPVTFSWDATTSQVVRHSNWMATVILVLYIAFAITKSWLLEPWISDPAALGVVTSAITAGAMYVRIGRTRRGIVNAVEEAFPGFTNALREQRRAGRSRRDSGGDDAGSDQE